MNPSPVAPTTMDLQLFQAMPGNSILLQPYAPDFTIMAATNTYVRTSGKSREALVGKPLFEVFPKTPDETGDESERTGRSSLAYVLERKEPHRLPVYRYDIANADGTLGAHYWSVVNTPVLNGAGTVVYIIHTAEDITGQVEAKQREQAHQVLEKAYHKIEESQHELQTAHQRMVDILESTTDAFYALDADFNFTYVNKRAAQLWQRDRDSLIGKQYWIEFNKAVGSKSYQMHYQALKEGHAVHYETISPLVGIWIEASIYPNRDGGLSVFFRDISDRKKTESVLRENEAELQWRVTERTADLNSQKAFTESILDASLDGIYALKAVRNAEGQIKDYQYLFANKEIAKLLHKNVSEIIGTSMLALLPENRSNGFFDLFCKLLETGETFRDETHFVTQHIDSWFDFVIVPINDDTLVVSIEDITEKKQSTRQIEEQRNLLDNILHNTSNGISVSRVFRDAQGKVIDAQTILANDAAVKYIGLPKDIYLSKRATEIEPTIIGSPYYAACIKTLETGEPFVMQYYMESTKRWLELTVSRLDHDHLIQIFTDVTLIKETQLQLERYVEELKRSNTNLEEFAYAASHDLKEPIRKIHFYTDRLKSHLLGKLEAEDRHYFERLETGARRMSTLIDDLLRYSHIGRGVSRFEPVDLNQVLALVLEDQELGIRERGAEIRIDPLPIVTGHRRQLQQLFENLLGNALKYSNPNAPVQIEITSRMMRGSEAPLPLGLQEKERQYHQIEVKDHGIGFEQEDAERIFNVFTRLHGNAEFKGSGVGLSIVRKVAENHHGYVWANSAPGEGAIFSVLLPVA